MRATTHSSQRKASRNPSRASQDTVAINPPSYGIDFIDQRRILQVPAGTIQREGACQFEEAACIEGYDGSIISKRRLPTNWRSNSSFYIALQKCAKEAEGYGGNVTIYGGDGDWHQNTNWVEYGAEKDGVRGKLTLFKCNENKVAFDWSFEEDVEKEIEIPDEPTRYCCCCVDSDITIEPFDTGAVKGSSDVGNRYVEDVFFGHEFKAKFKLKYLAEEESSPISNCQLKWVENTDRPPDDLDKLPFAFPPGEDVDFFDEAPYLDTFLDWPHGGRECGTDAEVKLPDRPACKKGKPPRRLDFKIAVESSKEEVCKDKCKDEPKTVTFTQVLEKWNEEIHSLDNFPGSID